jgi:uncharacterized membrane protein
VLLSSSLQSITVLSNASVSSMCSVTAATAAATAAGSCCCVASAVVLAVIVVGAVGAGAAAVALLLSVLLAAAIGSSVIELIHTGLPRSICHYVIIVVQVHGQI